jgi:uncharacterized protein (UPF0335 family)
VNQDSVEVNGDAANELLQLIERIENREKDKKEAADDIKDIYLEAKSRGYDAKTMRAIIQIRKMQPHDRQTNEALLETYLVALGMD